MNARMHSEFANRELGNNSLREDDEQFARFKYYAGSRNVLKVILDFFLFIKVILLIY